MIRFANWYFLILVPLIIYIFMIRKKKSALKFSSVKLLKGLGLKKTAKHRIGKYFIALGLITAIIALARPQLTQESSFINQNGIDIAMVLDVSGSMESVDFEPNRLEVARKTIEDFIKERTNDRISLIIFAGTAYTRVPLTLDHNIVRESLEGITSRSVNEEGTAIGMAISVGLNRLKKSEAASKIMILVTDGDNNAGAINPDTASELAKELGVRIYTIGVGTDKTIIPVQSFGKTLYKQYEGGLNEKLLKEIAETTNGQYYRARDSKALSQIFSNINQLEKTKFEQDNFKQYTELAFSLIKVALVLLLVGIFLDRFYFVQIP
ncbi:VWA domain-containing protein [Paramaledivibacter caminithermalis]|uniref:Ca-activated chloride channel family protein n=1 Tax=Paramaledivibacter caminithermalis (strain DSM 15212 / CIP 107654 / DViRD3) TaxID=1121301 RepID=A0A1M6MDL3_PARC5|nr:VWA domain-containing protein [Paramaledivibacter caminithermalis]SHJ81537.1 Ca-activated chloride channel family protein [Paramaledivibacter caminithermalis DSM 15212]